MIPIRTICDKRGSFGVHLFKKDPKLVTKWLNYGHFLPERLRDSIENHIGQKRESFGVHLYQKDPKSAKKWLSYGHFLPERLRDSIGKHMGQKGILWCSFVPKRSKISQEMSEIWLFSH